MSKKQEKEEHVVFPAWLRWIVLIFVASLIPVYWQQLGPQNFLWFSDIALLLSVWVLWRENKLIASIAVVSVGYLEYMWLLGFLVQLLTGTSLLGIADYMFADLISPVVKFYSFTFHVILAGLLPYFILKLGYDKRALPFQCGLGIIVLVLSYLVSTPLQNVNWVFGFAKVQESMPPLAYLALLMVVYPLFIYVPNHFLCRALAAFAKRRGYLASVNQEDASLAK